MRSLIDVGTATLEAVRPDLVVVRFKPGSVASAASFRLSMEARRTHFSGTPHAVLLVAPMEVDFDPAVIRTDHYEGRGTEPFTLALALVSADLPVMRVLRLYYELHPAPFPVEFFTDERSALAWLDTLLSGKT